MPELQLELYEPNFDTGFRIEDLGIDPIDFYRNEVILQTEADYKEYHKSPNALSDYHGFDHAGADNQLQNAYEDFLGGANQAKPQTASMLDFIKDGFAGPDEPLPGAAQPEQTGMPELQSLRIVPQATPEPVPEIVPTPQESPLPPQEIPAPAPQELPPEMPEPQPVPQSAPEAQFSVPLQSVASDDEIITLEEPALPETLTAPPVVGYNDQVQNTTETVRMPNFFHAAPIMPEPVSLAETPAETVAAPTSSGIIAVEPMLNDDDFIEEVLVEAEASVAEDGFIESLTFPQTAAELASDDDDELISLTEIEAVQQPEHQRVQIAEPDANLQQLVEDITTERVTAEVLESMPQTLMPDEQLAQDLRPMINIISNTQVMENVMNRMVDRVLSQRLLPQLEEIIRNTVRDVLKEEMSKHQKTENE